MRLPNKLAVIINRAIRGGILHERAENGVAEFEMRVVADLNLNSEWFCACLDHRNCLRVNIVSDEERFATPNDCMTKRHRFGCGRRFI